MTLKTVSKILDTEHFTIELYEDFTGMFEHDELGDEWGGGLWFDPMKELLDYDGVYELPAEVIKALKDEGYWGDAL